MTSAQIQLVQDSMAHLVGRSEEAGNQFYQNLFEAYPHWQQMFHDDIETQARKFMTILIHIIANLDRLTQLEDELGDLGKRHRAYQVQNDQYEELAVIFFKTMKQLIPSLWNPELEEAWQYAYYQIAKVMKAPH